MKAAKARNRKWKADHNGKDISKSGFISDEVRQKYNDTRKKIAQEFEANKKAVKNMPSWERNAKKKESDARRNAGMRQKKGE